MIKRAFFGVLLVLAFASCGKEQSPIPDVPVYFQASLLDPKYSILKGYNVSVIIPGGVAGIIIYHDLDGSYLAYDRCSSYQPAKKCAVTVDSGDLTVTDPCSGSQFNLRDGTVAKPPASAPLRQYAVNVSNNVIFVSN